MSCKVIPVKVALRIRPLISKETNDGCRECVEVVPNEPQVIIGSDKPFTFDYVFGSTCQQEDLYNQVVEPLMDTYFNGYNVTVLAYGQTGSGKTYSMGTCATINTSNVNDEMNNAVIPRVIKEIFRRIENQKEQYDFLVKVSFLEIHNEEINDLLNQGQTDDKGLTIRENTSGEIKINGLKEVKVSSVEDMAACLEQGSSSRATGATAMNTRSSRSHAIFTIVMEQKEKSGSRDFKRAKFHLVDLAGSEKAKKTQATGERFKEGVNINKGLLSLGNVISALGDEQRKAHAHVPYRDSKLTRLLQDSLGGNSNTVMVACVSPADSNMEETHNTLKYADRARKIKNKPVVNRDPAAAELSKLRQQVQMLQLQLLEGQFIHQKDDESNAVEMNSDMKELFERNKQLEIENERLTTELHGAFDQATALYEKNMLLEMSKDKLKQKAEQLKEKIQSRGLEISFNLDEDKENVESADIIKHIQTKVEEMDQEDEAITCQSIAVHPEEEQSLEESHVEHPEIANSSFAVQHALRKAELCKQLQELTNALAMKEEIASKMVDNERITSMRKQHEMTVKELEHIIEKLEKEKSELNSALNSKKANPSSLKKDQERLRVLETQLSDYKKKQIEYKKLQKTKEQSDKMVSKLDNEIKGMKQMKVKLMRQMKEEADKFRQWKSKKEKEINQLKQQGRKRQFEYKKLESIHLKQQAVLRRKTEEAAAANKRLKVALSKQKEALEKRTQSLSHQNKQSDNVLERMKSWLSHEVELMVSANEARRALKEIIEDRKTLSQEISALKSRLQEKMDEPSCKRVSLGGGEHSSSENDEIPKIRKQIQTLEIDLEVRSSQITDLQQKIIDAEQGDRTKYRWNNIHTMAEAKAGLKSLLNWVVESKVTQGQLMKEKEDCKRISLESGSNLERLKGDYEQKLFVLRSQNEEISQSEKRGQEKIVELMNTLAKTKEINEEQSENIRKLEEVEIENTSLRQRLEAFTRVLSPERKAKRSKNSDVKPEIIDLSDIEFNSPQVEKDGDYEYIPTTDSEFDTPVMNKKRPKKSSFEAPLTKKTSKCSSVTCACKGDCSSKRCKCKAADRNCTTCKCSNNACRNRSKVLGVTGSSDKGVPAKTPVDNLQTPESKAIRSEAIPSSASPRTLKSPMPKPVKSNSPAARFAKPTKTVGLKSRRRSSKYHIHSKKKLLNTSNSTNILTPSKAFVAPMRSLRKSTSQSKLHKVVKPMSAMNDENKLPESEVELISS